MGANGRVLTGGGAEQSQEARGRERRRPAAARAATRAGLGQQHHSRQWGAARPPWGRGFGTARREWLWAGERETRPVRRGARSGRDGHARVLRARARGSVCDGLQRVAGGVAGRCERMRVRRTATATTGREEEARALTVGP